MYEIVIIILSALLIIAGFAIRNLTKKNEMLEDFIAKQSEAIDTCDQRLKTIDDKGFFVADDEIGWFFTEIKKIQEALNQFRLR
jgi:ABC-type Zn2+ transport system substrate-binding protein/surface adhesin